MAKYLVTGGCGFIGSHLVDLLISKNHQVIVIDDLSTGKQENLNSAAELIVGSILEPKLLAKAFAGVDGCFHLAALVSVIESQKNWLKSYAINNTGTMNVFDAARLAQKKLPVVFASSAAVFGDNPHVPLDESAATYPISIYGADKLSNELYGRIAHEQYAMSISALRFFNVFGSRQDPSSPYSGVISLFMDKLSKNLPVSIFGDGEQCRDFINVADVAMTLAQAMEQAQAHQAPRFNVYNICTGKRTSINELCSIIARVHNIRAEKNYLPWRLGDIKISYGNPAKMNNELGFKAQYGLEEGLRKMKNAQG